MARALIVGCGCRGSALGRRLLGSGWQVRGTTRSPDRVPALVDEGIEGRSADPTRPGTVLEHIEGVTVVCWLMGSAAGKPDDVRRLHGDALEAMLEELSDTHVRGFLYEAAGSVEPAALENGAAVVRSAGERWRLPIALHALDPFDDDGWAIQTAAAVEGLIR